MNKRIGRFITQGIKGNTFQAYIPPCLPPQPPIDLQLIQPILEKATHTLAQLNSLVSTVPNIELFVYMYVRKEALLSSQIEGTQSSFADLILFENDQKPSVSLADVTEVSNYVKAIQFGLTKIKNDLPLSLRLLREIHTILLSGSRGTHKKPGEFRKSQNWIGGTQPGNALFVPPPVEYLAGCLSDFENFLHDKSMPVLIQAGLAHVQFETIHPFLDGNGRLGRLLIILLLCHNKLLDAPILYISLYLKKHRTVYYDLLQRVRLEGAWEAWLQFFLEGVYTTAKQTIATIKKTNELFASDIAKIETVGRARFSCIEVLDYVTVLPQVSVPLISQQLNMSAPTARNAVKTMVTLGILQETSGLQRNKIYVYKKYLDLLEEGAEPL